MPLRQWGFPVIFCGFGLTGRTFRFLLFHAIGATPFRWIEAGPMFPARPAGAPGPGVTGACEQKKFSGDPGGAGPQP